MCLEESFCSFTRDALNFRQPKIYAAPHRTAPPSSVQVFPSLSAIITAPRDSLFNILLYHSAQLTLMLTGKAKSAQITCRQEISM